MRRVRRGWPLLALALASGVPTAHASWLPSTPPLVLDGSGLTTREAVAARGFLDTATAAMPPALVGPGGDGATRVRWRDDLPAHVDGRARGRGVALPRRLLAGWMSRPPGAGDGHATRAAMAALVHELAHVHDRSRRGRLSSDPRLLDLAGWQVQPLRPGLRTRANAFTDRSPDVYELASPAEFVAVNLEHFVLDPDYACRRPALHAYFAAHFAWSPPRAPCAPGVAYLEAGADAGVTPLLQLDPARVHAIDYLLAEGNANLASRWGHGMLRLVVCAPGRPRGPDCRLDLEHHRVLSFRAFVDDLQLSSWRGLTGSYPSRLFVLPLDQVVDEYTRVELRTLRSIPLRLEDAEIASLLERTAQLHWGYDGRYRFIGNNCAVETYKLLHDGVPRLAGARLSSITPTGLLRRLERAGVADASVLDDPVEAVRLGYRFESLAAHFDAMYAVAQATLSLPAPDALQWMALPPPSRAPWLERGDVRASAALLLLEQAALRRQEVLARDELKRALGDMPDGDAPEALQALLREGGLLAKPANLLPPGGYGLPQQDERAHATREARRHMGKFAALEVTVRDEALRHLAPGRRQAIADGEANVAALSSRLRQLHRDAGGVVLE